MKKKDLRSSQEQNELSRELERERIKKLRETKAEEDYENDQRDFQEQEYEASEIPRLTPRFMGAHAEDEEQQNNTQNNKPTGIEALIKFLVKRFVIGASCSCGGGCGICSIPLILLFLIIIGIGKKILSIPGAIFDSIVSIFN